MRGDHEEGESCYVSTFSLSGWCIYQYYASENNQANMGWTKWEACKWWKDMIYQAINS